VAGLRTDGGGWIRPVSPTAEGTLSKEHYTLADGTEAGILDVIEVDVSKARPESHQPENGLGSDQDNSLESDSKSRRTAPRDGLEPHFRAQNEPYKIPEVKIGQSHLPDRDKGHARS